MLNDKQKEVLTAYRDKSFVSAILYEEHANYYSFISSLFSVPLIILSSAMTVINSSFSANDIKVINIILNASTSLILSLVGNFKFGDRSNNFKNTSRKMTLLCHSIEDYIINDIDEANINVIRNFIKSYDDIEQSLDYSLINSIKKRITDKYKDSRTLPNSLNCVSSVCFVKHENEPV